jgi:hypothetical protein
MSTSKKAIVGGALIAMLIFVSALIYLKRGGSIENLRAHLGQLPFAKSDYAKAYIERLVEATRSFTSAQLNRISTYATGAGNNFSSILANIKQAVISRNISVTDPRATLRAFFAGGPWPSAPLTRP